MKTQSIKITHPGFELVREAHLDAIELTHRFHGEVLDGRGELLKRRFEAVLQLINSGDKRLNPEFTEGLLDGSIRMPDAIDKHPLVCSFVEQYHAVLRAPHIGATELRESDLVHSAILASLMRSVARMYDQFDLGVASSRALVHDAPEIISGDVPTIQLSDEEMAAKGISDWLASEIFLNKFKGTQLARLVLEYEKCESVEAQAVKIIDKATPSYANALNGGKTLRSNHNVHSAEDFIQASRSTNRKIAHYHFAGEHILAIALVLEARIFVLMSVYDIAESNARALVYGVAATDGLPVHQLTC